MSLRKTVVMLSSEHREKLCNLKPMLIPRPNISTMRFVTVSGNRGYYTTISKKPTHKRPALNLNNPEMFQKPSDIESPSLTSADNNISGKQLNVGLITSDPEDIPPPDYD
uniref:Uncharacterized protein n=1 Tax=Syphacia muris TaxID=451379 RepID=A0A0N5AIT2_9BILA